MTGMYWNVSWNPIIGCSGCGSAGPHGERCWARRQAARGMCDAHRGLATREGWTGEVRFREKILEVPLHWRKPRVVAVNWMGDMFSEKVPDEWIDRVYAIEALCPLHRFLHLTKRSKRRRTYMQDRGDKVRTAIADLAATRALTGQRFIRPQDLTGYRFRWPLPQVWEGATAWDQPSLDEQVPDLLATPAAHRWLSLEPLLEPVDLDSIDPHGLHALGCGDSQCEHRDDLPTFGGCHGLDWVVCGGETGVGARPMHPGWARDLRDQCAAVGVPFFLKSLGTWIAKKPSNMPCSDWGVLDQYGNFFRQTTAWNGRTGKDSETGEIYVYRIKGGAGRLLDGREHNEVP